MKYNLDELKEKLKPNVKKFSKKLIIQFIIPPLILIILVTILSGLIVGIITAVFDTEDIFGDESDGNSYSNNTNFNNVYDRINYSSINFDTVNDGKTELEWLYKATYAERGNGDIVQQGYVASVILNRALLRDDKSVYGVISAKGQFESWPDAINNAEPTQTTKDAVQNVIQNGSTIGAAKYFMTPSAANKQNWLIDGLKNRNLWVHL